MINRYLARRHQRRLARRRARIDRMTAKVQADLRELYPERYAEMAVTNGDTNEQEAP